MTSTAHDVENDSLWWLAASPAIWCAHLLVCYPAAAIWCAKAGRDASLDEIRWLIAAVTALALAAIAVIGWRGMRRHRVGVGPRTHEHDTPEDRHRFLGLAMILLSGLAAVGVIFVALPAVFMETCR